MGTAGLEQLSQIYDNPLGRSWCSLISEKPEQSGFSPSKSTVDGLPALRVLMDAAVSFGRKCLQPMSTIKEAFESVHREPFWDSC